MGGDGGKPRKRGRQVRVDLRRNRGKPARDKRSWTHGFRADEDATRDAASVESVRAKGELSRKRTVFLSDDAQTPIDSELLRRGTVLAVRGLVVEVDDGAAVWPCTVRRVLRSRLTQERQAITVGDRVMFLPARASGPREGVIEHVLPRQGALTRQYEDRVQVIAANVDQAVIVASADDPPLRPHLIDRFIVAAHKGDLRPVVVVNKLDLDRGGYAGRVLARYRAIGYTAVGASVPRRAGIDELRAVLAGKTSVIAGMSGVGKSSLLNAMEPGLRLRIGDISDTTGRGRHTTTTAELLRLSFGGYVVDTPGIRQFELAHIASSELEAYFIEFVERVPRCRIPGCTHLHEPGCAIIAATEAEEIDSERYASYVKMMTERLGAEKGRYG